MVKKAKAAAPKAMASSGKMCHDMTPLCWVTCVLLIVGALNWGLFGLFEVDLVAWLLGPMSTATRVVYVLVGLAGVAKLWKVVSKM